jgi:hypothetical protein
LSPFLSPISTPPPSFRSVSILPINFPSFCKPTFKVAVSMSLFPLSNSVSQSLCHSFLLLTFLSSYLSYCLSVRFSFISLFLFPFLVLSWLFLFLSRSYTLSLSFYCPFPFLILLTAFPFIYIFPCSLFLFLLISCLPPSIPLPPSPVMADKLYVFKVLFILHMKGETWYRELTD